MVLSEIVILKIFGYVGWDILSMMGGWDMDFIEKYYDKLSLNHVYVYQNLSFDFMYNELKKEKKYSDNLYRYQKFTPNELQKLISEGLWYNLMRLYQYQTVDKDMIIWLKRNNVKIHWIMVLRYQKLDSDAINDYLGMGYDINEIIKYQQVDPDVIYDHIEMIDIQILLSQHDLNEDFIEWISENVDLTEYKVLLCTYQSLSEDFMRNHLNLLCFETIAIFQYLSDTFIRDYVLNLDLSTILEYQNLGMDLIRNITAYNSFNWYNVLVYQNLDEDFIYDNINIFQDIAYHQQLSEKFIETNIDYLSWENISRYQKLSKDFIEKNKEFIDFELLEQNENINFDISDIKLGAGYIKWKKSIQDKIDNIQKDMKELEAEIDKGYS